jgi:hypothetical protein
MKLTSEILRKIIQEEAAKFGAMTDTEDVKADETDADEFADSLEKKIDYIKALKIEESRLKRRLAKISEARKRTAKSIAQTV